MAEQAHLEALIPESVKQQLDDLIDFSEFLQHFAVKLVTSMSQSTAFHGKIAQQVVFA